MNVIAQAQFKTGVRHYDMSDAERKIRVEAAAAFRLAHHYRWNLQINNHICVRIPGKPDHFLMNPYGLGWDEITASNLATVRMDGEIVSHEGVTLGPAGLNFHSGILDARPDLNCTMHVHARPGVAVAATKQGLIIVDQSSMHLYGEVGCHDFEGFAEGEDEVPAHPARPRRRALPADVEPRPADRRPHHRGILPLHAPPGRRLRAADPVDVDANRDPAHPEGRARGHPRSRSSRSASRRNTPRWSGTTTAASPSGSIRALRSRSRVPGARRSHASPETEVVSSTAARFPPSG